MPVKGDPIAVFDSGMGGISVLRELVRAMPNERFVYFGDSANAPYGSRPTAEIRQLSRNAYDLLAAYHPKATVIACNTATAAAVDDLRRTHPEAIIVGIEPALRPAVRRFPGGNIVVMATEATLREQKFARLMAKCGENCHIVSLPCPELVGYVERGELDSPALRDYLRQKLTSAGADPIHAAVLGCTHYPFVRHTLQQLLPDTVFFDGGEGTAKHTRDLLRQAGLLADGGKGDVVLLNSRPSEEFLKRMRQLFEEKV